MPRVTLSRAPQDAAALCEALKGNTCLRELSCSSHKVAAETAALFAQALATNAGLAALSVGDSTFGDEELRELSKVTIKAPGTNQMRVDG